MITVNSLKIFFAIRLNFCNFAVKISISALLNYTMVRTFHHQTSPLSLLPPVLSAAAALWLLWTPRGGRIVLGLAMVAVFTLTLERILHTAYIFTDDDKLVIDHGKFHKQQVIHICEIVRTERFAPRLLQPEYILICYGAGHKVAVRPVNSGAFLAEIKKRQG